LARCAARLRCGFSLFSSILRAAVAGRLRADIDAQDKTCADGDKHQDRDEKDAHVDPLRQTAYQARTCVSGLKIDRRLDTSR
jgi:hypothetical protein